MRLSILSIEDNEDDARMLYHALRKKGMELEFNIVSSMQKAMDYEPMGRLDVIFLDLHLPDMFGIETLRQARKRWPDVAIIVLSGHFSENQGVHLKHEGADYVLDKNEINMDDRLLGRAIYTAMQDRAAAIADRSMMQKTKEAFERVQRPGRLSQSSSDPITGKANEQEPPPPTHPGA